MTTGSNQAIILWTSILAHFVFRLLDSFPFFPLTLMSYGQRLLAFMHHVPYDTLLGH